MLHLTQIKSANIAISVAVFAVTSLHLSCHAQAADPESKQRFDRQTNRALYQATAQFKLASENKSELYALMATAVAAAKDGGNAKQIVKSVARARQKQISARSVRETGKWISPNARNMIVEAASVLGANLKVRGKPLPGAEAAFSALARGALWAVEAGARGEKTYWAYRRHTEDRLTEPVAQRRILKLFAEAHDAYPELRKASPDLAVTHEIGFSPTSSRAAIIASVPDRALQDTVRELVDNQADAQKLARRTVSMIEEVRRGQTELTETALTDLDSIAQILRQDRIDRIRANTEARKRQALAIKVRGIESMVYLASTLVGFGDPKLGHQIQTIGDASIRVYKAWNTFTEVTRGFSELKGFASAALSADLVGAGLAVIGLFLDTGPTPDEIIIEQIGALREQVEQGRVQMHQRFDLVDRRLVDIHVALVEGLGTLARMIEKDREAAARHSATMRHELLRQQELLSDLYPVTIDRAQAILKSIRDRALARCVRRRSQDYVSIDIQLFGDCVAQIRSLVLDGEIERIQLQSPRSPHNIAETLARFPDATVNIATQRFRDMRARAGTGRMPVSGIVVGPESWIHLARVHDRFLRDWPEHRSTLRDDPRYARKMNQHRAAIGQTIESISADLAAYAEGKPNTVFGALAGSVRRESRAIVRAIRRASAAWRQKWRQEETGELLWYRDPPAPGRWQSLNKIHERALLNDPKRVVYMRSTCSDREWKEFKNRSSLPYWMDPKLGAQTNRAETPEEREKRRAERLKKFEQKVRDDLRRIVPNSFVNMLAAGVGGLEICVLGDVTRKKVSLDRFVKGDDASRGAYYNIDYEAEVLFKVRWIATCEGRKIDISEDGWASPDVKLEILILPKEGRTRFHHELTVDTGPRRRSLKRRLIGNAYWDARYEARLHLRNRVRDLENGPCMKTFKDRFIENRKAWISRVIDVDSEVDAAIRRYDREVETANAFLRAWIRLALHDAIPLSDAVAALATGSVGFPLWKDAAETGPDGTLLDRPARLEAAIRVVERVLRSEQVAYMARENAGYAGVTGTAYDSLDPDHPDVKRYRAIQTRFGPAGRDKAGDGDAGAPNDSK